MGTYREYNFRVREEDAISTELRLIDECLSILKEKGCLK
jgi:hypothetical protein